jgi:hypothetical protein
MNKNFRVNALIVIYFAGFISCLNTGKTGQQPIEKEILTQADMGYLEMDGDSILIPDFDIEVSLSPNAEEKLKEDHETVIVSAMFYGTPKDTLSDEYQFMGVSVKNYNIELTTQRIARFEKIRFHSSILNKLSDFDIFLLINVFSGRRSSENNILDVEILEDKMSVIKGKKYILRGKLIGEGD